MTGTDEQDRGPYPFSPSETRLDSPNLNPYISNPYCSARTSCMVTPTTRPTMSASRGNAKRSTWHLDLRMNGLLNSLSDLHSEPLLHLEAPGEDID